MQTRVFEVLFARGRVILSMHKDDVPLELIKNLSNSALAFPDYPGLVVVLEDVLYADEVVVVLEGRVVDDE